MQNVIEQESNAFLEPYRGEGVCALGTSIQIH